MKRITPNSRIIFHYNNLLCSGIFKQLTETDYGALHVDPIYIIWDDDLEDKVLYGISSLEKICAMSGSNWHLFNNEKEMLNYILKNG
jgi:hypothetical protein